MCGYIEVKVENLNGNVECWHNRPILNYSWTRNPGSRSRKPSQELGHWTWTWPSSHMATWSAMKWSVLCSVALICCCLNTQSKQPWPWSLRTMILFLSDIFCHSNMKSISRNTNDRNGGRSRGLFTGQPWGGKVEIFTLAASQSEFSHVVKSLLWKITH